MTPTAEPVPPAASNYRAQRVVTLPIASLDAAVAVHDFIASVLPDATPQIDLVDTDGACVIEVEELDRALGEIASRGASLTSIRIRAASAARALEIRALLEFGRSGTRELRVEGTDPVIVKGVAAFADEGVQRDRFGHKRSLASRFPRFPGTQREQWVITIVGGLIVAGMLAVLALLL